jgi:hypothetical protein
VKVFLLSHTSIVSFLLCLILHLTRLLLVTDRVPLEVFSDYQCHPLSHNQPNCTATLPLSYPPTDVVQLFDD